MGRRQRHDHAGAIHHVMNRGLNRQPVFFADADRVEFGRRLAEIHDVAGIETIAYCLMGNHYHLLLRSRVGNLSDAMRRLGSTYTTATNRRVGRDGPLFRGRFHSIQVTDDRYLMAAIRYIHRNALDLPGVSSIEQYRWSSMRAHLGLRAAPAFLDVDFVRGLFDDDLVRLREFHVCPDWNVGVDALRSLFELVIADDDLRHGSDDRLPQHLHRTLAVLIAHGEGPPEVTAAAAQIAAFTSEAARRMALSRARARLQADPSLQRMLRVVYAHLGLRNGWCQTDPVTA